MSKISKKAFSLIELSIVILVIGIVLAGITSSSILISKYRLNSARNLTQSSPVSSIQDLVLWYESTSENSFDELSQEDGQAIQTWFDINPQSSQRVNITQDSLNNRPTYDANAINNLPAVSFDGENSANGDVMTNDSLILNDYTEGDQMTIFVVENRTVEKRMSVFFIHDITDPTKALRISSTKISSGALIFDYDGSCCSNRILSSNITDFTGNHILSYIKYPTTSSVRSNGVEIASGDATVEMTDDNLAENVTLFLGYDNINSAHYFQGHIGEFIIFRRALKAAELRDVENYLSQKWGIAI